ncbi:MAG TPA: DNA repair protein RecN [Ktedonobacterales bacterium]
MLLELSITNFAIIDHLRIGFDPHLNVFTGETGAGKSIIVDAISALVGERTTTDVVRAGSDRASVEGVFDVSGLLAPYNNVTSLPPMVRPTGNGADDSGDEEAAEVETLASVLAQLGIEPEDGLLILTREVMATGRGIARINRRAVPISSLQRIARFLIDIHGQSAHLELLRPEQHVFYLDRYAGTVDLQRQVADLVGLWRAARREIDRLRRDEREIERRVELLRYQVDEIEAARLQPGEVDELEGERRRLANAERLGELCVTVHGALAGDSDADTAGALDLLATAQRSLHELLRLDDTLREQEGALDQALYLLQDVSLSVASYQDEVAADPQRQAEVEERLDLLSKLRRKYGATIEEILAYATSASEELDGLTHREERISELQQREEELKGRIGALAGQLSRRRQAASERLSVAMEHELDELNMRRARFQVRVAQRQDADGVPADLREELVAAGRGKQNGHERRAGRDGHDGRGEAAAPANDAMTTYAFGPTGIDEVEFLIAPNPGEPFKPLARIASGGETSRLMLALKTILSQADIVPILIFDEIDSGISGRSGQVVGEKLWQLGRTHQVLSVTHLPQIAALGDRHYRVAKATDENRTTTQVTELAQGERIAELSQMLGGASTAAARANAEDLLTRGASWKEASATISHPA